MNVFGENEIVTTVEYGQAKYDFCANNKANQQNMDFIFKLENQIFLTPFFRCRSTLEQVKRSRTKLKAVIMTAPPIPNNIQQKRHS